MRSLSAAESQMYRGQLERELGPAVLAALLDPTVVEVLINEDGQLRVDRLGAGRIEALDVHVDAALLEAAIHTVAHLNGEVVSDEAPVLWGKLPWDGTRVSALLPPTVEGPCISLRKHLSKRIGLDDYVQAGRMSPAQREELGAAVTERRNILVAGGTGTGKTTLINALMDEVSRVSPNHRLYVLEKVREIHCPCEDVVQACVTPTVSADDLLRASLRMRPDRIVVGEVLGPEALTMIKAWNTGHPGGMCSVHADSAESALMRLEQCAAEATGGYVPRPQVASAVGQVVFLTRGPDGPLVQEVLRVHGLDEAGQYQLQTFGNKEPS